MSFWLKNNIYAIKNLLVTFDMMKNVGNISTTTM